MGKLTDYGIVLMGYFAAEQSKKHSAHELSESAQIPLPTVRKVLKALSQGGLLTSERGAQGGYSLARQPKAISVAEIITALEGPIALTECVSSDSHCEQESHCSIQTNWDRINNAVYTALDEVKLADMLIPNATKASPIVFYPTKNKADIESSGELNG
jgi:FeS assembly SUF system regulator